MKRLLTRFKSNAGFTLIELLVVIGILGVLASALVATIDPFEQLNKAQDANVKNASVEFLNSNIRYFTTHNAMPWFDSADGGTNCYSTTTLTQISLLQLNNNSTTTDLGCMKALIDEGELKQGFATFNGLSKIFVTNPNPQTPDDPNSVIACYKPISKSGQKDPLAKYAQDGSAGTTCISAGGATPCYWCAQ